MFKNLERSKIDKETELFIQVRVAKLTSLYSNTIQLDTAIKKVANELSLKQKVIRQHLGIIAKK